MELSTLYLVVMCNMAMIGAAVSFTILFSIMDEFCRSRLIKSKKCFLTDVKLVVIASVLVFIHYVLALLGSRVCEVFGWVGGLLYILAAIRIALRSRGIGI